MAEERERDTKTGQFLPRAGPEGAQLGLHNDPAAMRMSAAAMLPGDAAGNQAKPAPENEGEDIIYTPGPGDPSEAKWRGIVFKANVPVRVKDKAHIEAARGNRFFRVGDEAPAGGGPPKDPKTPMEYRAHAVEWIKASQTIEDVVKHWAEERTLRQTCEVGSDDVQWLGHLVEPKLHQFKMAEGLSDHEIAGIWIKYGVFDLPWRS